MFLCHECGLQFQNIEELNYHIGDEHLRPSEKGVKFNDTNQFFCKYCNKYFKHQRSLTRHIRDKTCLRCRFCKKSFDSTFLLKQHRDTHFENLHKSNHQASKDLDENDVDDEPVLERTGFEEKLQETVYKISSYKDTYKCFQR